jgi:hypothetical protein
MNYLEKYKINNLINLLDKIYHGNNNYINFALETIKNSNIKNGWINTVYLETKRILEAEIDLYKSIHIIHVINLLNDVIEKNEKKEYMMYEHPSWYELIKLRSPFEYPIAIRKCCDCGNEYPYEAIGDFADLGIFNCSKCDKILVGTLFAANNELKCKNGGVLVFNMCPKCMSQKFEIEKHINPYKYFSNHIFINQLDDC